MISIPAIRVWALVLISLLPFAAAAQQTWPNRAARVISTSPPGGSVDLFARIVADEFSKTFGQPFVVENRPGANGNIGVDLVVKAPADGHMFFVAPAGPFSINASIMGSMPFNPKTDIAPIAMLGVSPLVLVVHPSVPAKNLNELIGWLRVNGSKVNYASQAIASTGYFAMELLKLRTGVEATHIPYKGSGAAATNDLIAGRLSLSFANTSVSLPHIRNGQLRAIAVAELKRISAAPDIPTLDEAGQPGFEATSWFGLGTRAGTPRDVIQRLSQATMRVLARPEIVAGLHKRGIEPRPMMPEPFTEFLRAESTKWEEIIRRTGAKVD